MILSAASRVFSQRDVHLSLFDLLLNHAQCDVNIADSLGWTPLYQAAYNGEIGNVNAIFFQTKTTGKLWIAYFAPTLMPHSVKVYQTS